MRKLILLLSFWSILTLPAFSQVTLTVEDVIICDGETTVDVPVTIDYSGPITGLQFELQWDDTGLDLADLSDVVSPLNGMSPVGNISGNSVGLSLSLFSVPVVAPGDTVLIFTFQVTGSIGGVYPVQFVDPGTPSPEVSDGSFIPITPIFLIDGTASIFGLSPVFQGCPADIIMNTDAGQCGAVVPWTEPTVFDCDENDNAPTVNFTPGSFFPTGTTPINYMVSDTDGNTDMCSFNVTVLDNEQPTIADCQSDTSLLILPGLQGVIAGSVLEPTTDDNCSIASLTYAFTGATIASGTFDPNTDYSFNTGMTTVTFTATDPTGNPASCSFVVTVVETDAEAFVLDIDDITVDCGPDQVAVPIIAATADTLTSVQFALEWGSGLTFNGQFENPGMIPGNPVFGTNPDFLNISYSFSGGSFIFAPGDTLIVLIFDVSSAVPGDVVNIDWYTGPGSLNAEASDPSFLPVPVNIFAGSVTLDFDDPPMITCPADTTVDCGTPLDTSATGAPIVMDDCDPNPEVTFVDAETPDCGNTKVIVRTFTVTDSAGNIATCEQIITVQDTTPPMAVCKNITIQLDGSGSASIIPDDIDNGSSDACGDVTLSLSQTDFDCTQVGDNPVTLTVEDPCGNQDTCMAIVTVQDTLPPTALCQGAFVYLDASGNASITPEDIDGGSVDNCNNVTLSISPADFTCDNVGANTVTLTVEDDNGNQTTCEGIVTVLDTILPTVVCQDVTAYLDQNGSVTVTPEQVDGGTTDNCDLLTPFTLTPNTFGCDDIFNPNPVTLTVEDVNGNINSCSAQVTVLDTIAPMAVCQDATVYLDENGEANFVDPELFDGGSSDNCGVIALGVLPESYTCDDLGDNPVTLQVKDTSDNITTCMATVTVLDTIAPELICEDGIAQINVDGTIIVNEDVFPDLTITDNCTLNNFTFEGAQPESFDCSQVGQQEVTLVFSDESGNIASCTNTISVEDNIDPVAVCQNITVDLLANGTVSVNPGDVDGGSFDNCASYTYAGLTPSFFECDDIGPNEVTLTVIDNSGNTGTCTATVTVQDVTPPVAVCQDVTVALGADGTATLDPAGVNNNSTDNCTEINLDGVSPADFTCDDLGDQLVTLTVSDNSGNAATCTAIASVVDELPPVAACEDITVQLDPFLGTITITPDQVENGSTDNCSPVVTPVSVTPSFFECGLIGPNLVELVVEDDFGNTSTCSATVTVEDAAPPQAVCFNTTVYIGLDGTASIEPLDVDGGSFDNCGDITLDTVAPSLFDCSNVGSNMVTLTVSDPNGNSSTCMAFVTVADTIPPVAVCQDVTVQLDASGMATVTPDQIDNGSNDNCGQATTADLVSPNMFDCTNIGDNTVTLTVSDNFDNTATCTATVSVQDTLPPTAVCQDVTVLLDASGTASVTTDDIENGSTDNCGNTTALSVVPAAFDCSSVGDNMVTLTVEDENGNQASCEATVTVQDTISPEITCPATTILTSTLPVQVFDLEPILSDNCSPDSLAVAYELAGATVDTGDGDASGIFFNPGTTNVTYTVTDGSGNSATCSFQVIVNPIDPPTIACPTDTTVYISGADCTAAIATGLDVTIDSDPGLVDSIYYVLTGATSGAGSPSANGEEFEIGMTTVTYFVADTFMNVATCSFTVTVLDTIPPVVTCPSPATVVNDEGLCSALIANLIPTIEECEQDSVKYTLEGATTASGLGIPNNQPFNVGLTTLTYEVVDDSGNTGSCSVDITVLDNEGPVVNCLADVVVSTALDTCGAILNNLDVTASDNCDASVTDLSYTLSGATLGSGDEDASGSFFNIGETIVTYTATDSTGNTGSCSFSVTVEDMTPPVLTCPGDQLIIVDQGDTSAIVNDIALIDVLDNCTETTDTNYILVSGTDTLATGTGDASGNVFPVGSTTVTYFVSDTLGNEGSCSFEVLVVEGNNLDIECPMDTMVVADTLPCELIVENIGLTINEDSVLVDTVFFTLSGATTGSGSADAGGTSFAVGTTTVTYTVLDTLGIPSVCSFEVTVIDSIAPVVVCPDSTTFESASDLCGITLSGLTADVTECSDFDLTYELSGATTGSGSADTSQITFNTGFTDVTFTATDANGLTGSCTYTIEVVDAQPPMVSCIGDTVLVNDPGLCSAVLDTFGIVDTFDNCGITSILYTYSGATTGSVMGDTSGIAFNVGLTDVEIIVGDAAGNQDTCSFTVTVVDDKAPGFECPNDFTISTALGDSTAAVFISPDVADNCGVVDTIYTLTGATTGSGSGILDTLFNAGVTTVTYIATDISGNTTECVFNVTVELAVEVEIACPNDIIVDTDPGLCTAVVDSIDIEIVAGASGVDQIFYLLSGATAGIGGNSASGTVFNKGNTTVTYNVIDALGDTLTCSFVVTVEDNENPMISCPDDILVNTDADTCGAVVTWSTPVVSDNCPGVNVSSNFDSGDFFPIGTTAVTYTATDGSGNTAVCDFNVIVEDNIPPVVLCSNDLLFYTTADTCGMTVNDIAPDVSDNCEIASVSYELTGATTASGMNDAGGLFFNTGTTLLTYTVLDSAGNTGICQFDIDIIDTIPPTLECPENVIVFIPDGQTSAVIDDIAPIGVDDNCGILGVSFFLTGATGGNGQNDASGTSFNLGTTIVTYAVNDTEGNFVNCSFTVTVNPEIDYELDCPSNVVVYSGPDTCGAVVNNIGFVVLNDSGNLSDTMYTLSAPTNITGTGDASGNFFQLGSTNVAYTVMDIYGNAGGCSFNVVVVDSISPEIVCPPDLTVYAGADTCGAVAAWAPTTATDNCNIFAQDCDFDSGDFFPLGMTTVTCTATDDSGNAADCSFTVTVLDTLPPVISCPSDLTVSTDAGQCSAVVNDIAQSFEDNCAIDTVYYNLSGATTAAGANDASGSTFNIGTTTVTYTVIDNSNNLSTCSFDVTVEDTELPVIECPGDTMISTLIGQVTIQVNIPPDAVSDNCGVDSYEYTLSGQTTGSGTGDVNEVFNLGVTVVTYTVTDNAGNTNTCSFEVFVVYDAIPKVECPNNQTVQNDPGMCSTVLDSLFFDVPALDSAFLDTAYHELTGATVGVGPWDASGTAFNVGITEIVYHVIDTFGNEGTCTFTVNVLDVEDPIIECPDTLELPNDPGLCQAMVDTLAPISFSDNCGIDTSYYTLNGVTTGSGENLFDQVFNVGTTQVTFTVVDPSGNSVSCTFPVIVSDEEAPEIECMGDTLLYAPATDCAAELCNFTPLPSDNCGVTQVVFTLSGATSGQGTNEIDCQDFNVGLTTVTFFAVDGAGNSSTCSFDVTVLDTIAPVLDCPINGEANTVNGECYSVTTLQQPDVIEACGVDQITYTLTGATEGSGDLEPGTQVQFNLDTTFITYEVIDVNGNSSTCSFYVTIIDDEAPTISCPEDTVITTAPGACTAVVDNIAPEFFENCTVDTIFYTLEQDGMLLGSGTDDASGEIFELGTTEVTYVIVDQSGNADTCSFNVTLEQGALSLFVDPGVEICEGVDIMFSSNATPGLDSVVWEGPANFTSNILEPEIDSVTLNNAGVYTATFYYPDGCVADASIELTVFDQPDVEAFAEDLLCTDGTQDVTLEGILNGDTDIASWIWLDENGMQIDSKQDHLIPNATSDSSGVYTVIATSVDGCQHSATVELLVTDKPAQPNLINDCAEFLCLGEACTLIGEEYSPEPEAYIWEANPVQGAGQFDTIPGTVESIRPTEAGEYTYSYSVVINGCQSDPATVDILVVGQPEVENDDYLMDINTTLEDFDVFVNDNFDQGIAYDLEVTSEVEHGELINNGDGTFTYTPDRGFIGTDVFVYRICYDECDFCDFATVNIRVAYPSDECVIPTIITPNGDGVNDELQITCLEDGNQFPNNEILIFNQWGDEVFRASPYENDWDGTYEGNDLPDGVYFYIFKTGLTGDEPQKGSITIFR